MVTPAPATAARRVAALLVSRLRLEPPVDIEALLRDKANVHRVDWPYTTVDAILTGLGHRGRPDVYYRATENLLRERFTLAHEFGHLVLPWHMPEANCKIGKGSLDLPKYSPEDEADVFASCLLMPDNWLLGLIGASGRDMSRILRELNEAETTTYAGLLALRRVLLAGWVFTAYGQDVVVATPGTYVEGLWDLPVGQLTRLLRERSVASGEALLNGHPVQWFSLVAPSDLPERDPGDGRTPHQLLVDAISMVEADGDERKHLAAVCNGIVGGTLREAAGRPAVETFDVLRYKFEHSDVDRLLNQPEFVSWVAEKARAIEIGDTKRIRNKRR